MAAKFGVPQAPLTTGGALAAREMGAVGQTAPPSADPLEIAALEMLLGSPENEALIRQFGTRTPIGGNPVADGVVARYGADLAERLNQFQTAKESVRQSYFDAMDEARQSPNRGGPFSKASAALGWTSVKTVDGYQQIFDPVKFTREYAAGDSPQQRAFNAVFGPDAMASARRGLKEPEYAWAFQGQPVRMVSKGDHPLSRAATRLVGQQPGVINLSSPPGNLVDNNAVWFDADKGWMTDPANIKPKKKKRRGLKRLAKNVKKIVKKAAPFVASAAASFIGGPVLGKALGSGLGAAVAKGAVSAAVGSTAGRVAAGGSLKFKDVLKSALHGAATAGLNAGVGKLAGGTSVADRLLNHTGNATMRGAVQQLAGGKFGSGFTQSLLGDMSGELTRLLDARIANVATSSTERSMLRLLSAATETAFKDLGSVDASTRARAQQFLNAVMPAEHLTIRPQATH